MNAPDYSFTVSDPAIRKRARCWLLLGVIALGIAGIFAGLLANTKSPFFYTALVVHVDLSVLVWFLTIACMFFTLARAGKGFLMLAEASYLSFAAGAGLIIFSAFTGGEAYMSNYIPVIHHPLFFLGLGLLFCGVVGATMDVIAGGKVSPGTNVQRFGVMTAAWMMLVAMGCFIWSAESLPRDMTGQIYYEYAFWGGGHVLQFVHTQLMLVAWFWLASACGLRLKLSAKHIALLYGFGVFCALAAPFMYLTHDDVHSNGFTLLMRHANGLSPLIAGGFLVAGLIKAEPSPAMRLPRIALAMSILLFAAGGALGYFIAGSNVIVPAHYHGSIVGVTLAFMGVAYLLLPALGAQDVSASRLAQWQPVIYGGGQLCWMAGMAILGAHGVPRKTPGSADTVGALAAFLKHGGDGLALIGGLLFVFIMLRAFLSKRGE